MKAQGAFEYMLIVTALLAIMIPVWVYVTNVQYQTNSQLTLSYARNTVEKLVAAADLVYSQGPPAKVNMQVYIPPDVKNITFINTTSQQSEKWK